MEHHFADCTLDDARLTLTRGGHAVAVEPKVFDLIQLLVRNAGNLVTRDQMVDEVWGGRIVSESAISACIAAARKAVGDTGKAGRNGGQGRERRLFTQTAFDRGLDILVKRVFVFQTIGGEGKRNAGVLQPGRI